MSRRYRQCQWRAETREYFERARDVLVGLEDYWPLTLRQVFYQLVAAGFIENSLDQYKKLSRILSKARMDGLIPWEALEDRSRNLLPSGGWPEAEAFIQDNLDQFLGGYRRDLLRGQDLAPELWVEKDALSRICHRAAFRYCVPVVVAKGFSSISYLNECRERVIRNADEGKNTIILYFGDLDPSGWEMLPSMLTTLQAEMGLEGWVEGRRCALTMEQVQELDLPTNPDALKFSDSRARKYLERFGDLAVELDAISPPILENMIRESIEEILDMDQFRQEETQEEVDRDSISDLRGQVREFVRHRWGGLDD